MYDLNINLRPWIYAFEQRIANLEKKQCELEAENQRLKEQLLGPILDDLNNQLQSQLKDQLDKQINEKVTSHLADQKHSAPQNITYKIQELHVNELKGTLNIGLTAPATTEQMRDIIDKLKTDQTHISENIFSQQSTDNE
ncbi:spore germination protein GerPC [Bacillus sp. 3255]|uniref:spore germination protein GerPC n=1 Tax=Bacillus sp. 3255 TaxID=2817904 RepID=UPI002854A38D|nr:spore germination protein GerPC [Bacillus sp. 3255]MDR6879311.1 hypothetical protein [Bacillus sp. 3255]